MNTIIGPLRATAAVAPRTPQLSDGTRRLDAARTIDAVDHLADLLRIGPGSGCVASRLDNGIDALLVDLACRSAGLVHVAIPPFFSPQQTTHVLRDCRPAWLALPTAAPAPGDGWSATVDPLLPDTRLWRRHSADPLQGGWPDGTVCITYTSGSTGDPKGVCLDEATLVAVAASLADAFVGLDPRRHLCALPLSTLLETIGVYAALRRAAEICVPSLGELGYSGASGLDPGRLHRTIQRHRPDSLILVPQLLDGLMHAIDLCGPLDPVPRLIAVGGARVGETLLARARARGLPVFEGYGLSEAGSVVALNRPDAVRSGSVGRPLPHLRLQVADDGEVWLDGIGHLGYLGGPERTPGPLPTGDLGWIDDDGFLHLSGRKRNVFITAYGRNVSPEWIEAELTAEPAIAQALVTGEAQPWNLALLVPSRRDIGDCDLSAALVAVNRRLPDYARIAAWLRIDEPFSLHNGLATANGRLRRAEVIERYGSEIRMRFRQPPEPELLSSATENCP